jgi:DNA polymerase-4
MTAVKDITDREELQALICYLSDKISARMIKYGVKGCGVHVDLRSSQLKHTSKQKKLLRPTFSGIDIAEEAFSLAQSILGDTVVPLRTITVSIFDLCEATDGVQLSFFDKRDVKRENLDLTLDKIRNKYGRETIKRANLIARDFIYDKDDAEDFLPFKR